MSSIIIDGYNLIGIEHKDLNRQREKLILRLIEYKKIKGHEITVVFDGWKSGSGKEEQSTTGGVRVIYSRLAEKADAVIKRIISKERKEWIVISSDREIMSHAWACGSIPIPSSEFQVILERSGISSTGEYDPLEEECDEDRQRKGNSRQPSKKEKALLRARNKL
ncbi:MAG: hypothetical protein EHM54_05905 [Nitrospiraceae bacterium]|nr:MAG: hypothetical protein EHM54_05905 [Nitrospiraceae bacterium]